MGLNNSNLIAILADTCINVILMHANFFVALFNVVDPDLDFEPDLVDHNKIASWIRIEIRNCAITDPDPY
jgi:hypothetical protein